MLTQRMIEELERIRRVEPTIKHYDYRDENGTILATAEYNENTKQWVDTTDFSQKKQKLEQAIARVQADLKMLNKKENK